MKRYKCSVPPMDSASQIIGLWPSAEKYAADIGLKYPSYARVMKMRGRIPHRYWDATLLSAARRNIPLTLHDLELAHAHIARDADLPKVTSAHA